MNNLSSNDLAVSTSQAQPLIDFFITDTKKIFGDRVRAIYKIGSLARGDFSLASDADVALFLDQVKDSDCEKLQALVLNAKQSGFPYSDRFSIYWSGTPAEFKAGRGRFPALDRLDLLLHGVLIDGNDIRSTLAHPSHQEIVLESAAFIYKFMLTPEREVELKEKPEVILQKGARYFSKFVLFPVRLIFTLDHPDKISSNRESVAHYYATWHREVPQSYDLIQFAYDARKLPVDDPVAYDTVAFQQALLPLYDYCINRYKQKVACF